MNQSTVIVIAVITAYLVWLIVFVLLIERWLRLIVGRVFGLTITRELQTFSGPSSNITVLDVFDAYRWKIKEPARLPVRCAVGLLRVGFWAIALSLPVALGLLFFFSRHTP